METQTKKSKEELKEIILSDDSNIILPEVSFPSSYTAQPGEVKLGSKSIDQKRASEHELLDYQKRISRKESILTSDEIRNLMSETNERRRALEQSILLQKQEFEQKRAAEIVSRRTKEREEACQFRIAHENETQKQMRLAAEDQVKTRRAKEIQSLINRCRKEKEQVETFFLQSSNRFNEKYGNATKKIADETGIDRIISSRPFSTGRFAHRCVPCGYNQPESLSISKTYLHIFENKNQHMQFTIDEIDTYYNTQIADVKRKHAADDNPDEKQKRISRELEGLKKLKGEKYR